jgi:hypothetical protein
MSEKPSKIVAKTKNGLHYEECLIGDLYHGEQPNIGSAGCKACKHCTEQSEDDEGYFVLCTADWPSFGTIDQDKPFTQGRVVTCDFDAANAMSKEDEILLTIAIPNQGIKAGEVEWRYKT